MAINYLNLCFPFDKLFAFLTGIQETGGIEIVTSNKRQHNGKVYKYGLSREGMEISVDIKPTGVESAVVYAPFDKAKETLENKGYRIISLEENAKLRIQQGREHNISKNGNWTREGFIYTPKKIFLTKNSPIMENPKEATECHRKGVEYCLTDEQIERALENSVEIKDKSIPTDKFGENELTAFAFGEVAEDYGRFLKEVGIKEMPIYLTNYLTNPSDKSFSRQVWFGNLGYRSLLGGNGGDLDCGNRLRGVSEKTSEAGPQKILYSEKQISKALKELGFSGLEKNLISKLK